MCLTLGQKVDYKKNVFLADSREKVFPKRCRLRKDVDKRRKAMFFWKCKIERCGWLALTCADRRHRGKSDERKVDDDSPIRFKSLSLTTPASSTPHAKERNH